MAIVQGIYIYEDGSDLPPEGTALDIYSFDLMVRHARTLPPPDNGNYCIAELTDPAGNRNAHNRGWISLLAHAQEDLIGFDFQKAATLVARHTREPISAMQFRHELQPSFVRASVCLLGQVVYRDKKNVVEERMIYYFDEDEKMHVEEYYSPTWRPRRTELQLAGGRVVECYGPGPRNHVYLRLIKLIGIPKIEVKFPSADASKKEPFIAPPQPR